MDTAFQSKSRIGGEKPMCLSDPFHFYVIPSPVTIMNINSAPIMRCSNTLFPLIPQTLYSGFPQDPQFTDKETQGSEVQRTFPSFHS